TEPLGRGAFVKKDGDFIGNCRVCAIGAILRAACLTNDQIQETATRLTQAGPVMAARSSREYLVEREIRRGHPWNALSILFETGSLIPAGWQRQKLVDLVDQFFPDEIKIPIYRRGSRPIGYEPRTTSPLSQPEPIAAST